MSYPNNGRGGLRVLLIVVLLALGAASFLAVLGMAVAGKFPL